MQEKFLDRTEKTGYNKRYLKNEKALMRNIKDFGLSESRRAV